MNNMIYVIVTLLMLFMILLKITFREKSMIVETSMLQKHLSFCRKFLSCSCSTFLCMSLCASSIYFLMRCLCIGSGLGLNVFHIFFLMLSFASKFRSEERRVGKE